MFFVFNNAAFFSWKLGFLKARLNIQVSRAQCFFVVEFHKLQKFSMTNNVIGNKSRNWVEISAYNRQLGIED